MSTLGNIIWFIFMGWWNFLLYGLLGLLCTITIIGIPIGKALFQYAKLMALPFGKVIIKETELKGKENVSAVRRVGGVIANIIWLPVGVIMFITSIIEAVALAITIIGIPAAIVLVRSGKFLIWPVGAKVITKEQADTLRMERSMMKVMGTAMAVNQSMMQQPAVPSASQQPMQQRAFSANQQTAAAAQTAVADTFTLEDFLEKSRQIAKNIKDKLLQYPFMVTLQPYVGYLALVIFVIHGIALFTGSFSFELITGLLFLAAAGLEIILDNRLVVLIMLGGQVILRLVALITLRRRVIFMLISRGYMIFSLIGGLIFVFIYGVVLAWYVLAFVKGRGPIFDKANFGTGKLSVGGNAAGASPSMPVLQKRFCGQCGTECVPGAKFCPKCGAEVTNR